MRKFKKPERDQLLLITEVNLESVAPPGSAIRAIDELVEQLDTSAIENTYDFESICGANPMHPKTLIKVSLFALHNCRFSLRKMEADTKHHLGYRWLTGDETIDHSTMGKFLSRYKLELPELFSQVVLIGVERELIDFEVLNIDTVKIRANASYKQFRTNEGISKEHKKLQNRLEELINQTSIEDQEEEKRIIEARIEKLESAKNELLSRIEKKSAGKSEREQAVIQQKERINITDNDCGLMQQANGETNSAYGITAATDSANDFITHFEVQEIPSDAESLIPVIEGSMKTTGERHNVVNADSGFSSLDNLEHLEADGQSALIPDKRYEVEMTGKLSKGEFDRSHFIFNEERDCYICPENHELAKIASVTVNGRLQNRYANRLACKSCEQRKKCTKSKNRIISRDNNEAVKERMRECLSTEENKKVYTLRSHSAESPFGQIKHNLKYRIFMRRGREKIRMEMSLLCMLHNILKIGRGLQAAM